MSNKPNLLPFSDLLPHALRNLRGAIIKPQDSYDHYHGKTIVLSPWFTCTPWILTALWEELREYFNVIYSPSFPNLNTWSIYESGELLRKKINGLNGDDINLLGHSLGWLISIQAARVQCRVNNIITMSTPFYGTPLASIISMIVPACSDMNRLWGYHKRSVVDIKGKLTAFISEKDSIVPQDSQIPNKGIAKNQKIIRFPWMDHWDLISGATCSKVAKIIDWCCK